MTKKICKKLIILCLLLILSVATFFTYTNNIYADTITDKLVYTSFGDSIAAGYGLANHTEEKENNHEFISDSYQYLLKNYFNGKSTNYCENYTFANSGDKVSDLIEILTNNTNAINAVKKSDIITICIGANNLLKILLENDAGQENSNIMLYLLGDITLRDLEIKAENALVGFKTDIQTLIGKINNLNSNCKIIFTNIYNPFKDFKFSEQQKTNILSNPIISIISSMYDFEGMIDRINKIENLSETFINSGKNSNNKPISGLNIILQNILSDYDNYYLIDTKTLFDNYDGPYSDLVNANVNSLYNAINSNPLSLLSGFDAYVDPHPTINGHQIIFNNFKTEIEDKLCLLNLDFNGGTSNNQINEIRYVEQNKSISSLISSLNITKTNYNISSWTNLLTSTNYNTSTNITSTYLPLKCNWQEIPKITITFNSNGGTIISSQTIYQNTKITKPENPTRQDYDFIGWFTDNNSFNDEWDFDETANESLTLYAKWQSNLPTTYTITFNSNGGTTVNSQTVISGNKIIVPENPTKQNFVFKGWYTDNETFNNKWNFEQSTVVSNITLYAKWNEIFKVYFKTGDDSLNFTKTIENGEKLQKPTEFNRPNYPLMYWYKDNENNMFDFDNTTITQSITLNAKYYELICDSNLLSQIYSNNMQNIEFSVNCIGTETFKWYVNDKLIEEATTNTYTFIPILKGQYEITCFVNDNKLITQQVNILAIEINKIAINYEVIDNNYVISVINDNYYIKENITWFKADKNGKFNIQIAQGVNKIEIPTDEYFKIIAIYNEPTTQNVIQSNTIAIEKPANTTLILIIAIVSILGIGCATLLPIIIKKVKMYKKLGY